MIGISVAPLLDLALRHPAVQAGAIILATFILEDAATVLAAMQAATGAVSISLAVGSLYVGIVLGDVGLYGLGWLATLVPWICRALPPRRTAVVRAWLAGRVFKVVLISRFLPGLRLPTYTTCGFLGANFRKFVLASMMATVVWTSGLFALSMRVGDVLIAHFGAWRWAGAAGMVVFLLVAGRAATWLWKEARSE